MSKIIDDLVALIRRSKYGRDVRGSIADGIEYLGTNVDETVANYRGAQAAADEANSQAGPAAERAKAAAARAEAAADRYTFVIDSDQALEDWANNTPDNDYSRVYIKKGTWSLSKSITGGSESDFKAVVDLSDGRTDQIVGEAGSKLELTIGEDYMCGMKGDISEIYPSFSKNLSESFERNLNVEVKVSSSKVLRHIGGICNFRNIYNSNVNVNYSTWSNGYGYGFFNCYRLVDCFAYVLTNGQMSSFSYCYYHCSYIDSCQGDANSAGTGASAFKECAGLQYCSAVGRNFYRGYTDCFASPDGTTSAMPNTKGGSNTAVYGWNLG